MTKIFKHLAKHWAACLVIIALLLVQAYGDLTLPDYTSKIVDTGIQQSGIADAVPEVVRDSTLQVLELLMTDADAAAVEAAYTQPGGTDNALSSATSLQKKLASPDTVRLLRADADRDEPYVVAAVGVNALQNYIGVGQIALKLRMNIVLRQYFIIKASILHNPYAPLSLLRCR